MCSISIQNDTEETDFDIEKIDLNLCTHIICIDSIWDKTINPWTMIGRQAEYERFTNLRYQYPHLKVFAEIIKCKTLTIHENVYHSYRSLWLLNI